jgi:hypothetical protein
MANTLPIPPRDPNSKPNAEFVKDLKAGLRQLWNGRSSNRGLKEEFICFTLNNSDLRRIIESRLLHYGACTYTYGNWVRYIINVEEIATRKLQAGRKAWMLDLIEEFSE